MAVTGVNNVLTNLNKAMNKIKEGIEDGVAESAEIIESESKKLTPVDSGALKDSHYTSTGKKGSVIVGETGLTEEYAVPVHENLQRNYDTGEAKFLEKGANKSTRKIVRAVSKNIKQKAKL